jgi:hypothetical protein
VKPLDRVGEAPDIPEAGDKPGNEYDQGEETCGEVRARPNHRRGHVRKGQVCAGHRDRWPGGRQDHGQGEGSQAQDG